MAKSFDFFLFYQFEGACKKAIRGFSKNKRVVSITLIWRYKTIIVMLHLLLTVVFMSKYSPSIRFLLKQCETESGYSCDVSYDNSIQGYSVVRMAGRDGRLRHQIVVKERNEHSEYYIAWQAVFVLRHYQVTDEDRANISFQNSGFQSLQAELLKLHPKLNEGALEGLTHSVLSGIITQLRSVPIGILVDTYLYREFKDLREYQKVSLTQQVHEYWNSLNIDKTQFPKRIISANQHMNAAHAAMVNYQYPSPELFSPYKLAGLERSALQLLDSCLSESIESIKDKELIDTWGEFLNLKDLYRWV